MTQPSFKIGLTMAGAVSAGSYTAGVIDYLLETLELWEKAKSKNRKLQQQFPADYFNHPEYDKSVPMHEVQLEVMSGASAGGITGTLTAISLLEGIEGINQNNPQRQKNKLYQSWVEMADTAAQTTLSQLMSITDLNDGEVESLLNTEPIHIIAENALHLQQLKKLPNYVAADLDLILTISNLRGIKYMINFEGKDENAGTTITNHSGFFRYRFKNDFLQEGMPASKNDMYFVLDLEGTNSEYHKKFLKSATLSTGAFPIGLKPQKNSIHKEYIHRYTRYVFNREEGIEPILPDDGNTYFEFDSIDGGLINNEPFGYTLKVLKEKCPEIEEKKNFAIIMVDPFPYNHNEEAEKEYTFKQDIFSIGLRMFNALRNQVMFKQDEIFNALDLNDRTRFLIAPTRREQGKRVPNALACGALSGFSGFFSKSFREHDFLLGRQNCQSFLRYYFAIKKEDIEQKFGTTLPDETLQRFEFSVPPHRSEEEGGEFFFPIIPDLKVLKAFDNQYDNDNFGKDAELTYPQFPSITQQEIDIKYKNKISKRIKSILLNAISNTWIKLGVKIGWNLGLRKNIYNKLMYIVLEDLKKQGLLK